MVITIVPHAQSITTKATHAILIDYETGITLFSHNADVKMKPASMSKVMTILLTLEAIKNGDITKDTLFKVSENAWKKGGAASGSSTMFLKVNSQVSVEDLLRGVIIQSGNDASITLAEGLTGSEEAFSQMMTERAHELKLINTHFTNATGWPDEEHLTTAKDLALLTHYLIKNFPKYYQVFSEQEFTWNNITQSNRNPVLYANIGADGLKTGYTKESGYGLIASAKQKNRRIILVMNGLVSKRARATEAKKLINWGLRRFFINNIDQITLPVPVWYGESATIDLTPPKEFRVMLPKYKKDDVIISAIYDSPIRAPIKKGDVLGVLQINAPELALQETKLIAATDMKKESFIGRFFSSLGYWFSEK